MGFGGCGGDVGVEEGGEEGVILGGEGFWRGNWGEEVGERG